MSLEDALNRVANAIGMHDDIAVKEIIRQRDDAQSKLSAMTRNRDDEWERRTVWYERCQKANRSVAALKGVITRMKRQQAANKQKEAERRASSNLLC